MEVAGLRPRPRDRDRAAALAALVLAAAFAGLTAAVQLGATEALDDRVAGGLQDAASRATTDAMEVVSLLGSGWVVGPVAGVVTLLLLRARLVRPAIAFALAMLGAYWAPVLKEVFDRERPPPAPGFDQEGSFAYPSGHAMTSASFAAALVIAWPGRRRAVLVAAVAAWVVAVGVSRTYLGAHWTTDVVGGWTLSLAWAALVAWLLLPRRDAAPPGPRDAGPVR